MYVTPHYCRFFKVAKCRSFRSNEFSQIDWNCYYNIRNVVVHDPEAPGSGSEAANLKLRILWLNSRCQKLLQNLNELNLKTIQLMSKTYFSLIINFYYSLHYLTWKLLSNMTKIINELRPSFVWACTVLWYNCSNLQKKTNNFESFYKYPKQKT